MVEEPVTRMTDEELTLEEVNEALEQAEAHGLEHTPGYARLLVHKLNLMADVLDDQAG